MREANKKKQNQHTQPKIYAATEEDVGEGTQEKTKSRKSKTEKKMKTA